MLQPVYPPFIDISLTRWGESQKPLVLKCSMKRYNSISWICCSNSRLQDPTEVRFYRPLWWYQSMLCEGIDYTKYLIFRVDRDIRSYTVLIYWTCSSFWVMLRNGDAFVKQKKIMLGVIWCVVNHFELQLTIFKFQCRQFLC